MSTAASLSASASYGTKRVALGGRARRARASGRASSRSSRVVTPTKAFAPAQGDFGFSAPEGAAAGAIVLGARVFFIGLAKAGIGRRVDKYMAQCAEYGVATDDLFHTEDQPGDAWYLIGDWKPAKTGDPKHSDTTLVGILTTRAKTAELVAEAKSKGIDISDILATDYAPSFITNEKKRFVAIRDRVEAK